MKDHLSLSVVIFFLAHDTARFTCSTPTTSPRAGSANAAPLSTTPEAYISVKIMKDHLSLSVVIFFLAHDTGLSLGGTRRRALILSYAVKPMAAEGTTCGTEKSSKSQRFCVFQFACKSVN